MKEENKIFLKLYKDSQRRNYLKENINVFHSFLNNPEHPPTKVNKNEWNKIYTERFKTFQNKQKEKIRKRIIQEEMKIQAQEAQIIEQRNERILKTVKSKIDSIFDRMWVQIKTKQTNSQQQQEVKQDIKDKDKDKDPTKDKNKLQVNKQQNSNRISLVDRQNSNCNSILQKKLFLVNSNSKENKPKQKKTKKPNKPLTPNLVEDSQKRIHYFDNFLNKK